MTEILNKPGLKVVSPIDGDMLHYYDGTVVDGNLHTVLHMEAAEATKVKVNGRPATFNNGLLTAEIVLSSYKNIVEVAVEETGIKQFLEIYWLPGLADKYRLSIDDNIRFLEDLTQNNYSSLFDNPFLGGLKKLHDIYGTKVHLNLFYQTEGFNLSMMTDRYKKEWIENKNWLRLSFHALQEFPDRPYMNAGYEEVSRDCKLIMDEIKRFAGEELMGPVTTIHWGEANIEGSRAMRDAGYFGQLGYFNVDDDLPPVSYYLNVDERRHIKKRFIWKDNSMDIIFIKTSIVIDTKPQKEIVPFLEHYKQPSAKPPYVDLLVHEQYFYPDYHNYQPDYFERIGTAIQWAAENGYQPAFLADCIFENNKVPS